MAIITEMSGTKTEPQSYFTAVPALELYKIFSVFLAVSNPSPKPQCHTRSTNQILRLEILIASASPSAAVVRLLAFEAHEESQFVH